MNSIFFYLISLLITFVITIAIILYLRPSLKRILYDLSGTEERAHFWTVFCVIMMVATPLILGMGFRPTSQGTALFFEIATQIRDNLFSFLFTLATIVGVITFFALVAPKSHAKTTTE
jgi:hypothetical protein